MIRHRTTADIRQLDRLKGAVLLALLGLLVILFWSNSAAPAAAPLPTIAPSPTPTQPGWREPTPTLAATAAEAVPPSPAPSPTAPPTITPLPTATPGARAPTEAPASLETATPEPTECIGPTGVLQGNRYIVGECDTLAQISRLAGVNLFDLIAANPDIVDPDLIFPGQVVVIPRQP
jgi:nucleoid-associated protein YgaU